MTDALTLEVATENFLSGGENPHDAVRSPIEVIDVELHIIGREGAPPAGVHIAKRHRMAVRHYQFVVAAGRYVCDGRCVRVGKKKRLYPFLRTVVSQLVVGGKHKEFVLHQCRIGIFRAAAQRLITMDKVSFVGKDPFVPVGIEHDIVHPFPVVGVRGLSQVNESALFLIMVFIESPQVAVVAYDPKRVVGQDNHA